MFKVRTLLIVEAQEHTDSTNYVVHVEEFKKELTREVMLMTQEVTRLHRERQGLEQNIADLFAFYAKQKQNNAGEVCLYFSPSDIVTEANHLITRSIPEGRENITSNRGKDFLWRRFSTFQAQWALLNRKPVEVVGLYLRPAQS